MFLRALLAFLLLPGVVAFAVPIAWLALQGQVLPKEPLALAPLAFGVAALLACVRDFYVTGRGTLAPWAPPERLVVVGLYRWARNPMYIAVTLILLGWAAAYRHAGLGTYALGVAVAFHFRVVLGEEPWLARRHGAAWRDYACRVRRWGIF